MRSLRFKIFPAPMVIIVAAPAAEAGWQDAASACDAARLAKLDGARAKGLAAARAGRDAVGLLVATGPASARLEFPHPVQESTFDFVEPKG